MMVVSVLKRTSWCRTFVLGFAGSVATAIATYGATLRCAPYINVLLKDNASTAKACTYSSTCSFDLTIKLTCFYGSLNNL